MPRIDATAAVRVTRDGASLCFHGALLRAAVAGAWRDTQPLLAGVTALDVGAVARVDSAGVALLAELAARAGDGTTVLGEPPGLAELRAAYRLSPALAFVA